MKQLREITMHAPRITNVQQVYKNAYAYSGDSILFIVPCDRILGWTGQSLTIRLKTYDITYDNTGREISIVTSSTR